MPGGSRLSRYYDPSTGQLISVDPDVAQTQEPYAYAGDDPVSEIDPNGDRYIPSGGQPSDVWVYILKYKNGTPYYVGQTNDPDSRLFEHWEDGKLVPTGSATILDTGPNSPEEATGLENIPVELFGRRDRGTGILINHKYPAGLPSRQKTWRDPVTGEYDDYYDIVGEGLNVLAYSSGESGLGGPMGQLWQFVYRLDNFPISIRFDRLKGAAGAARLDPGSAEENGEIEGLSSSADIPDSGPFGYDPQR